MIHRGGGHVIYLCQKSVIFSTKKKGRSIMIPIPKNQLVWSFPPFCCKLVNKKSNYMKFQIPRLIEGQPKKRGGPTNLRRQRCNRPIFHRPLKIHDVEGANQQGDEVPHGPVDMECPWRMWIPLPLRKDSLDVLKLEFQPNHFGQRSFPTRASTLQNWESESRPTTNL